MASRRDQLMGQFAARTSGPDTRGLAGPAGSRKFSSYGRPDRDRNAFTRAVTADDLRKAGRNIARRPRRRGPT